MFQCDVMVILLYNELRRWEQLKNRRQTPDNDITAHERWDRPSERKESMHCWECGFPDWTWVINRCVGSMVLICSISMIHSSRTELSTHETSSWSIQRQTWSVCLCLQTSKSIEKLWCIDLLLMSASVSFITGFGTNTIHLMKQLLIKQFSTSMLFTNCFLLPGSNDYLLNQPIVLFTDTLRRNTARRKSILYAVMYSLVEK